MRRVKHDVYKPIALLKLKYRWVLTPDQRTGLPYLRRDNIYNEYTTETVNIERLRYKNTTTDRSVHEACYKRMNTSLSWWINADSLVADAAMVTGHRVVWKPGPETKLYKPPCCLIMIDYRMIWQVYGSCVGGSHCYTRAIYERFRDNGLIKGAIYKFICLLPLYRKLCNVTVSVRGTALPRATATAYCA